MQIRGVPHPYNKQIYKICKVTNYNHTSICNRIIMVIITYICTNFQFIT